MNWKFWKKKDGEYGKLIDAIDDLTKEIDEISNKTSNNLTKRFRYKKDGITKEYF